MEVQEGDYDGLVGVMVHLLAVKDRQAVTDVMFEPLKQTVELLSSYSQATSEDVLQKLEVQSLRVYMNHVHWYYKDISCT